MSNFHVVEEGVKPVVTFAPTGAMNLTNSERTTGEVVAVLPSKDLALISIRKKPEHVTGVSLGTSESVRIGDDVEAIGHPLGELWTYTRGYVSQIRQNYSWNYNESYELSANVIQTQTPYQLRQFRRSPFLKARRTYRGDELWSRWQGRT